MDQWKLFREPSSLNTGTAAWGFSPAAHPGGTVGHAEHQSLCCQCSELKAILPTSTPLAFGWHFSKCSIDSAYYIYSEGGRKKERAGISSGRSALLLAQHPVSSRSAEQWLPLPSTHPRLNLRQKMRPLPTEPQLRSVSRQSLRQLCLTALRRIRVTAAYFRSCCRRCTFWIEVETKVQSCHPEGNLTQCPTRPAARAQEHSFSILNWDCFQIWQSSTSFLLPPTPLKSIPSCCWPMKVVRTADCLGYTGLHCIPSRTSHPKCFLWDQGSRRGWQQHTRCRLEMWNSKATGSAATAPLKVTLPLEPLQSKPTPNLTSEYLKAQWT